MQFTCLDAKISSHPNPDNIQFKNILEYLENSTILSIFM